MNIVLVFPRFQPSFYALRGMLRVAGRKAVTPPLGLLTVAALLPPDWAKRLVDMNVRDLGQRDIEWADYVFVSAMLAQQSSAAEVITRCKNAGVKVVAGGPLFTFHHDAFEDVDHFVLNEAELTLPPFLEDLARGSPRRTYRTSAFADITRSPVPLWDLVDVRDYLEMSVQFSRGCPFACDFCNITTMLGRRQRYKTAKQVKEELTALVRRGWSGFVTIADDNLVGRPDYLKTDLLPAMIDWRRAHGRVVFGAQVSLNVADDPDLLGLMAEAGLRLLFVGIETPNEESLKECGKHQNCRRDMVADIQRLHRAGFVVEGGFVVGFDSDPPDVFDRVITLIQNCGILVPLVNVLQAPRGSPLFARMKQEDRILEDRLFGDGTRGATNIVPRMGADALCAGFRKVAASISSTSACAERTRTFLREFRPMGGFPPVNALSVFAFFRSLFYLGLCDDGRRLYWELLWWGLRHPRFGPTAVLAALYSHHVRIAYRELLREESSSEMRPARSGRARLEENNTW
jgi:radical SAM superfamily enzyme YgiQ (UPF0313 family)